MTFGASHLFGIALGAAIVLTTVLHPGFILAVVLTGIGLFVARAGEAR